MLSGEHDAVAIPNSCWCRSKARADGRSFGVVEIDSSEALGKGVDIMGTDVVSIVGQVHGGIGKHARLAVAMVEAAVHWRLVEEVVTLTLISEGLHVCDDSGNWLALHHRKLAELLSWSLQAIEARRESSVP